MQFANAITILILALCVGASMLTHLLQGRVQKWKQP
jgi:iron(III) transport system permease protein